MEKTIYFLITFYTDSNIIFKMDNNTIKYI